MPSGERPSLDAIRTVALLVDDAPTRDAVAATLAAAGYVVTGLEGLASAAVVLLEARADVGFRVAELRRETRIDAAIAILWRGDAFGEGGALARGDGGVDSAEPGRVSMLDAYRAGAYACLRAPFGEDEVVRTVAAAFGGPGVSRATRDALEVQSHLAAIGRISAALSHEFGNPLSVVSMSLDLLSGECSRLADGERLLGALANAPHDRNLRAEALEHLANASGTDDVFDALSDARSSLDRMRHVLAMIKELIQRAPRAMAPLDVGSLVKFVREASAAEILRDVAVEESLDAGCIAAAHPHLVEQVVLHFTRNAVQAARGLSSPRVGFTVRAHAGEVVLSVRDNGPGIDGEVQEKIFEPFYTTRRGLGGLGLGLALCREYAAQMGGRVSMWSVPGRGATFRLHLPRAR